MISWLKNKYKLISLQRWCDDRLSNQEESPGSTGKWNQVIPGERELRESATENKPPFFKGKGEKVR